MKRTYQPDNLKKSRTSGFRARKNTGVLKNRRDKGRKVLAH